MTFFILGFRLFYSAAQNKPCVLAEKYTDERENIFFSILRGNVLTSIMLLRSMSPISLHPRALTRALYLKKAKSAENFQKLSYLLDRSDLDHRS
jgi:hypothetical protein